MPDLFSETIVHLVIYFAILAILIGVALYVAGLFRAGPLQQEPKTEEHLEYFRELSFQGKLSESEFRIIKKQLSAKIVENEKKKSEAGIGEAEPDAAVFLARAARSSPDFMENQEETQLIGHEKDGETDDTVVEQR